MIVISRTERYTADLTGLLFGRILTVDRLQIIEVALVLVVVAVTLAATHKELVLRAFDPDGARAAGYPVGGLDLLVNVLIVLVVVAAARAVGTLLTMALLITPAATARLVSRSVTAMYYRVSVDHDLRLAPGATIVLATTVLFVAVLIGRALARAASGPTASIATATPRGS